MRHSQSPLLSLLAAVILVGVFGTSARAQTEGGNSSWPYSRVRGGDPEIRHLLQQGAARSATMLQLIEEIQRSNAIVIVTFGRCRNGQIRSCVIDVQADRQQRAIRILVDTRTTELRLIATIAHELQHAVEIVREPLAVDSASTMALYRRIGLGKCKQRLSELCETDLALATERAVLEELHR